MPLICRATFTRLDAYDKIQHVVPLSTSQAFEEPSNSLVDSITEQIPAIGDVCSLVEQKVSQKLIDKKIETISVSKSFDLYYQVNVESAFTACFLCITSKDLDVQYVVSLFESMRSSYVEVEYIRDAILTSSLATLPQFQRYINREIETLNQKMDNQKGTRVDEIQLQVDGVRNIMADNVTRVMERGDRLENLDQRAESLQQSSSAFKTSARRVQRNMCFKNLKWTIILSIVIGLLVILGLVLILKTAGVL